jgi:hypothetical protein
MHTLMHPALAAERGLDLLATATSARAARAAAQGTDAPSRRALRRPDLMPARSTDPADAPVAIRVARPADARTLARLAALDDHEAEAGRLAQLAAAPWEGSVLVAEAEGDIAAALVVEDGTVVADPFRLTDGLVALLRLRAAQLAGTPARHGFARTSAVLRPRLH